MTEQRVGPYIYNPEDDLKGIELITRGPFELDNGAIYKGQWSKDGLRYGRGM